MNNSLPRLIDGMVATLRKEVIPRVEGDYARGQAFGVIYMLNSLKLRCSWSDAFLVEQLKALEDASRELGALAPALPDAPLPDVHAPADLPRAGALEAMRDAGDAHLCDLIDWFATNRARLPAAAAAQAEKIVDAYLARQAKYEISTSARPMFVEMSGGAERT
jgi:hypothetical protein